MVDGTISVHLYIQLKQIIVVNKNTKNFVIFNLNLKKYIMQQV